MLLRRAEMEALANQGQSRFAAIDFDLLGSSLQERVGSAAAAAVFDQLAFALKLHAGLKFCNSIVGQSDGVRRVRPIEDVTVGQWLSHRQTKSSIQADTLGSLNERYTGLLDALPLMDVHDSAALLQLVTVLRVMTKMGGTPVRGKVEEDIRRLLAYAITLVAAYLRNPGPGKGSVTDELWRRAMLQESAFQLALREAHLSVVTGNISLVPDAVFGMINPETDPDNPPSRDAPLDPALLEPLLQMDDGPQLVDPSSYLRDVVIKPTMDLLFNLIRTISTAQPDNLCSLGCWRDVEDIFRVTDHISGQIRSATSVNLEGRLSNRNALRVLRTLLCVELYAVQSSVLLAVKVRQAGTRPMKGLAEEFVVANIDRLGNGPEGLMGFMITLSSDTPLVEVYHILDIVAFIHNLCRTSLPSALKAMSPAASANLKRNLKLASYWNPTPALLDFTDDQERACSVSSTVQLAWRLDHLLHTLSKLIGRPGQCSKTSMISYWLAQVGRRPTLSGSRVGRRHPSEELACRTIKVVVECEAQRHSGALLWHISAISALQGTGRLTRRLGFQAELVNVRLGRLLGIAPAISHPATSIRSWNCDSHAGAHRVDQQVGALPRLPGCEERQERFGRTIRRVHHPSKVVVFLLEPEPGSLLPLSQHPLTMSGQVGITMYASADSCSSCSSNLSVALRPRMIGFSGVTSHARLELTFTTRPPAGMIGENVSNICPQPPLPVPPSFIGAHLELAVVVQVQRLLRQVLAEGAVIHFVKVRSGIQEQHVHFLPVLLLHQLEQRLDRSGLHEVQFGIGDLALRIGGLEAQIGAAARSGEQGDRLRSGGDLLRHRLAQLDLSHLVLPREYGDSRRPWRRSELQACCRTWCCMRMRSILLLHLGFFIYPTTISLCL